jgi:hypothetical protein
VRVEAPLSWEARSKLREIEAARRAREAPFKPAPLRVAEESPAGSALMRANVGAGFTPKNEKKLLRHFRRQRKRASGKRALNIIIKNHDLKIADKYHFKRSLFD